ncbi:MAG: DUF6597 domain-containing transcriptional factor [Chloroflexota bacterium]
MIVLSYIPKPPLSDFVQLFWYYDGLTFPHEKERVMPDGSVEIVINLAEDRLYTYDPIDPNQSQTHTGCLLVGPRSECFVIDADAQTSVIGIHFKPGGAYPFLGCPSSETQNHNLSLDLLWGPRAAEMRERVLQAITPLHRFQVLEAMLLSQVTQPLTQSPVITGGLFHIKQTNALLPISELADRVGYSQRRFIQRFKEEVGMTPKRFSRIYRFQQAILSIEEMPQYPNWAQIALNCGYFDQAHFNHDFRAFSGLTPSQFATQRGERRNHVPVG